MKFNVAIKIDDYCARFSFDSEKERETFIENTKIMNPGVKVFTSEEDPMDHYCLTA